MAIKRSSAATPLLRRARTLAAGSDAQIWAVHVLDRARSDSQASGSLMRELEDAEAWLRHALVAADLESRGALPLVVVGVPAREIMAAIRGLDVDTVVLGSESRESDDRGVGMIVQEEARCSVVFQDLGSGDRAAEGEVRAP